MFDHTQYIIEAAGPLTGPLVVPGCKSISHRVLLAAAVAEDTSRVRGWLAAGDTEATLAAVRALGVRVERLTTTELVIEPHSLRAPLRPLDMRNTGTGMRLLAGLVAGYGVSATLDGSEQLRARPMQRVVTPLSEMGANITSVGGKAPLEVRAAGRLRGRTFDLPVASAQVKSAILFAGLFADGETVVREPGPSRDHTERLLENMGADITRAPGEVRLRPGGRLRPLNVRVPGDFSSAAFPLVAALLAPGSDITVRHVSLNPTRTGLVDVLRRMGARIEVLGAGLAAGEPTGDIRARASSLVGTEVSGDEVVRMIDEFPIFMVAALAARGRTVVRDAQELRVKETDRIKVMVDELRKLGAHIEATEDGFIVEGPQELTGARVESHDDHRVAMSMVVAGMLARGQTIVGGGQCSNDSFPAFVSTMSAIGARVWQVRETPAWA